MKPVGKLLVLLSRKEYDELKEYADLKNGGVIDGDLEVKGSLTVNGTLTMSSGLVKGNLIVTSKENLWTSSKPVVGKMIKL